MSQRTIRLGQLLLQEFSGELHTRWRGESVCITLTGVGVSPDLRQATVYYSVVGDGAARARAGALLRRVLVPLKREVFRRVALKFTPGVRFVYDEAPARGARLVDVLDAVAREDAARGVG
jgi:ribosome-binding factor A